MISIYINFRNSHMRLEVRLMVAFGDDWVVMARKRQEVGFWGVGMC